jgi:hypothetical protein
MFLRAHSRLKDGKEHRYWSIVESYRTGEGRVVQRQVLYLGEINDSQKQSWCRTIEVLEEGRERGRQVALFPEDRPVKHAELEIIQVRLNQLELHRARQWGACWLASLLWEQLKLDEFWVQRLRPSREGTRWLNVLKTLVSYRLIDPGSEWRLHRQWYLDTAIGDLLGEDVGLVQIDKLYRCLDKLVEHKTALFSALRERWQDLFGVRYEVLLYDLTSTYFECAPPGAGKRRFGYSRDKRSDCVQVVIALVVTPEGFPLAYEVMEGNTSDKRTLPGFLQKIEQQYGRAERIWIMDRGIPTEEVLASMRDSVTPVSYLVGTPRGRLHKMEKAFADLPWEKARESVEVKLLPQTGELYILARSTGRMAKERSIRQRRVKQLWRRLGELQRQKLTRDELLLKLGAAKTQAGAAYRLVEIRLPGKSDLVTPETFTYALRKDKLREARRREGHYLLRSNLCGEKPAVLWQYYIQLTQIEQVFKTLKGDLSIRPIYHQKDSRIEAHIFVAFQAYCLQVTLQQRLKALAPGLTPREVLMKLAGLQMVDVHLPTTDGRTLILSRYTQPNQDQALLLNQLRLTLPEQPVPRITHTEPATSSKPLRL